MRASLNTRFITLQKMDENEGTNQSFKNKHAYQTQRNWVHPKKFKLVKALNHQNPEGNILKSLTVSNFHRKGSASSKSLTQVGFLPPTGRDKSNEIKKQREIFVANFSVKKMIPDTIPCYRTLFPTKTATNFRKNLSPTQIKTSRD